MTKRFGRNQRRHLREKLFAVQQNCDELLQLTHDLQSDNDILSERLDRWASEILYLLGSDSAFNEQLKRLSFSHTFNRLKLQPVRRLPVMSLRDEPNQQWVTVPSVIEALILRCSVQCDDLVEMVRVEVHDDTGAIVGYGLPRTNLHDWSPRDTRKIADMIAHKMAEHLRKNAKNQRYGASGQPTFQTEVKS